MAKSMAHFAGRRQPESRTVERVMNAYQQNELPPLRTAWWRLMDTVLASRQIAVGGVVGEGRNRSLVYRLPAVAVFAKIPGYDDEFPAQCRTYGALAGDFDRNREAVRALEIGRMPNVVLFPPYEQSLYERLRRYTTAITVELRPDDPPSPDVRCVPYSAVRPEMPDEGEVAAVVRKLGVESVAGFYAHQAVQQQSELREVTAIVQGASCPPRA